MASASRSPRSPGREELDRDNLTGRGEYLRDGAPLVRNRDELTVRLNCVEKRPGNRSDTLLGCLASRLAVDDRRLHALDERVQESFPVTDVPIDRRHRDAKLLAQGAHR